MRHITVSRAKRARRAQHSGKPKLSIEDRENGHSYCSDRIRMAAALARSGASDLELAAALGIDSRRALEITARIGVEVGR